MNTLAMSTPLPQAMSGGAPMSKLEMTETIMAAKTAKGATWEAIATHLGMSEVYVTSACLGQNSMPETQADQLCAYLELAPEVSLALQQYPFKGAPWTVPTDPLIYRFYEIMQVYGGTVKELIHEKFGDGIMSAIDYTMEVEKQQDPKGDRVVVTMNGKFLPYRQW